jgi:prohibitin 2
MREVKPKFILAAVGGFILLIVLISIVSSMFAIVEPGHRGVKVVLGQITEHSLPEGFHFKLPWAEVHEVNVKEQLVTTSTSAASRDLQSVKTEVAVNFRPDADSAWWLYQNVGRTRDTWEAVILNPIITESVKAETARFTAEELVTQRDVVKGKIEDVIRERARQARLIVSSVNITDFAFSESFDRAIEQKVEADQAVLRTENELRRERIEVQKQVAKAEAEAEMRILQATAEARAIEERAGAQAKEIELLSIARAEAMKREAEAEAAANRMLLETLDKRVLENKRLERWDGKLPRVSGGGDPLILIDPERE